MAEPADRNETPLRQHLESLPQELYDEIYTLAFTPDAPTIEVGRQFQTPKMAQIDATSAAPYFSQCTFVGQLYSIVKWLYRTGDAPPLSNIRCYVWEWDSVSLYTGESERNKAFRLSWEVEDAEEDFGKGCCSGLAIHWTREEALQGMNPL